MASTLTLLDVTGIQSFIFGSNRLAENVGASYLVKQALGDWLRDEVVGTGGELLFSGGGNALVKSSSKENAKSLVTGLHLKLIEKAPGLGLACAHREESSVESFSEAYQKLHEELALAKREKLQDVAFDGLGVVAFAPPGDSLAVSYDQKENRWFSESSLTKCHSTTSQEATQDLRDILELEPDWQWSNELGKLGRTRGERSLLGVVHFDGNALGKRFLKASESPEALKALSEAVDLAGRETLRSGLAWLQRCLQDPDGIRKEFSYNTFFPVRPILFGGDDITLVCEGRIALDLAAVLLKAWRTHTQELPGGSAEACAGVALVPVNYPFYRAYKLSEQCCKDAKTFLHSNNLSSCSAIDWELSSGGTEQKRISEGPKTCKPYLIGDHKIPARDWDWFRNHLVEHWKTKLEEKHTQVKSLAEILRAGSGETREQLRRWKDKFGLTLPEPKGQASVDGSFDGHTPYLDALEILDRVSKSLTREAVSCH